MDLIIWKKLKRMDGATRPRYDFETIGK